MQTALLSLFIAAAAAQSSGKSCSNGVSAYCNGASGSTNIIYRCEDGQAQPGNCNDNLSGSLQQGQSAVCVENGDSAQCVAMAINTPSSTVASSASSTAYPGVIQPSSCPAGVSAYCQGPSGSQNIIARCNKDGVATLGNCNDNLSGSLQQGQYAVCVQNGNDAQCVAKPIASASSSAATSGPTCAAGVSAYCNGESGSTNIIYRCNNGVAQPGNCNDNLSGSLQQGQYAVCVQNGNSAQCVAKTISAPSSTLASSASPSSTQAGSSQLTCAAGVSAYCNGASGSTNIIYRCNNGVAQPGNCNDNLSGSLTTGQTAVCVESGNDAKCSAVPIAGQAQPAAVTSQTTEPSATVSILTGAATMNTAGFAAVFAALFAALI